MVNEITGLESEQMFITGVVVVMDYHGFTMSHAASMPLAMIKKLRPCWEVINWKKKLLFVIAYIELEFLRRNLLHYVL